MIPAPNLAHIAHAAWQYRRQPQLRHPDPQIEKATDHAPHINPTCHGLPPFAVMGLLCPQIQKTAALHDSGSSFESKLNSQFRAIEHVWLVRRPLLRLEP